MFLHHFKTLTNDLWLFTLNLIVLGLPEGFSMAVQSDVARPCLILGDNTKLSSSEEDCRFRYSPAQLEFRQP